MAPWLRFVEAWAVAQLLRTPAFHRLVEKVAKNVHRIRHGLPPEEQGGTRVDSPAAPEGFIKHFVDEIKGQLNPTQPQQGRGITGGKEAHQQHAGHVEDEGTHADAVWQRSRRKETQQSSRQAAAKDEYEHADADAAWRTSRQDADTPPRQGFMGEYMGALREQMRGGEKGK